MKVEPLLTCRECGFNVPPIETVVLKRVSAPQGIVVFVECPKCGTHQSTLMLPEELQRRANAVKRGSKVDKVKRDIGVLVKGFAVDLEAVNFLEDITMFWDYQESNDPGSIIVEDRVWKRGK